MGVEIEQENLDLKQSLNEIANTNESYHDDKVVQVCFAMQTDHKCKSDEQTIFEDSSYYAPIIDDNVDYSNLFEAGYNSYDSNNEEIEYDLYQTMNEYLLQIEECLNNIKTLNVDNGKKEEAETMSNVLDCNDDQEILRRINDIVHDSKKCVAEMSKEQRMMVNEERQKYECLDSTFKCYQNKTEQRIKTLTKEIYEMQYKKPKGYGDIAWGMFGSVGTYTKDAIVYKLTH